MEMVLAIATTILLWLAWKLLTTKKAVKPLSEDENDELNMFKGLCGPMSSYEASRCAAKAKLVCLSRGKDWGGYHDMYTCHEIYTSYSNLLKRNGE